MRKAIIFGGVTLLSAILAPAAMAATDVNFEGEVGAETCVAYVNGSASADSATVVLPKVGKSAFKSDASGSYLGATAGATNFIVDVRAPNGSTCGVVGKKIGVFFEANSVFIDSTTQTLNNLNTSGTKASGVNVQLLYGDSTMTPVPLGEATQKAAWQPVTALLTDTVGIKLPFIARYYSTSAAGPNPGLVSAKVQLSVIYE